jgi:hypothetical protein
MIDVHHATENFLLHLPEHVLRITAFYRWRLSQFLIEGRSVGSAGNGFIRKTLEMFDENIDHLIPQLPHFFLGQAQGAI